MSIANFCVLIFFFFAQRCGGTGSEAGGGGGEGRSNGSEGGGGREAQGCSAETEGDSQSEEESTAVVGIERRRRSDGGVGGRDAFHHKSRLNLNPTSTTCAKKKFAGRSTQIYARLGLRLHVASGVSTKKGQQTMNNRKATKNGLSRRWFLFLNHIQGPIL
jgi:hypothetical protein